eukprot:CAMPEP_0171316184 /NCGR_PEP_ID=MMETSP0816-20121228/70698_1 /TAXON_ID=420281 /ORGANISM="Proboscia inermis, Strain CCAP1064/1" /LENGTH=78 /DNA_ID=CAMNT_0011807799 /DNA_START=419 /DNA_END=652 /DNA_ORIENTATION=+
MVKMSSPEALSRLIEALAMAPEEDGDIVFSKLNIRDRYWGLSIQLDAERNFAYILPLDLDHPSGGVELVVPSAVQMGW